MCIRDRYSPPLGQENAAATRIGTRVVAGPVASGESSPPTITSGSPELRGALADTAQSCTDQLPGRELDYGAAGAAEDLEQLRQEWDVPGLAVLGMGTGAGTALDYAGAHPGRVALLVLDSPAPWDGDQESAARSALDGSDSALRLWAASCTRDECGPVAPDQKVDAVTRALDLARDPGAPVPAALLSDVVRSALGDLSGASAPAASEGDALLGDLVAAGPGELPASVRARAQELSGSSLPYVAGCSDLSDRVPVNRVPELAAEWSDARAFGAILAAQLSACSTWPVPGLSPVDLSGAAPVLLLGGIADPLAGANKAAHGLPQLAPDGFLIEHGCQLRGVAVGPVGDERQRQPFTAGGEPLLLEILHDQLRVEVAQPSEPDDEQRPRLAQIAGRLGDRRQQRRSQCTDGGGQQHVFAPLAARVGQADRLGHALKAGRQLFTRTGAGALQRMVIGEPVDVV